MRAIWKYTLRVKDTESLMMPNGAEILTVQAQGDNICLWAIVDTGAPAKLRAFEIFGLGHEMRKLSRRYIGTVQEEHGEEHGALVWHVFERL